MKYLRSKNIGLAGDEAKPVSWPRPFALSIRTKLLGLFLSLLVILAFSGYLLQNTMNGSLKIIEHQNATIQTLQATTRAEKIYTNLRWTFLNYLGNNSPDNYRNVRERLQNFQDSLASLKPPELQPQVGQIKDLISNLQNVTESFKTAPPDSPQATAMEADATKKLGQIDEILNNIANVLEDILTQNFATTREETRALHTIPQIFMIGGLLTLLFASAVTVLQLFIPLSKLTRAMTAASIDTTNARDYILPVARYDEIGMATEALNSLLTEVTSGIDRISAAERRLRDAGQHLQAIMDNVVDGVVTLNEAGRIETFSPSAEKIFQRPAADVIGAHISTLLFDNDGAPFDLVAQIFQKTTDIYSMSQSELMARTREGAMVPVEVAVGQTGYAGRTMYVATLRDIATRKQMENFIERAQRMETIGRMTGGIAHDFNNMLTVISGNFELIDLKMKENDPLLKAMIKMGLETVRKGKDMTQRLLAISSKQLLKPEILNLHDRIPAVVEMAQRAVREDVEMHAVIPPDIWNIRVDPVQFESALLNLAINARDALPAHGGRITIEVANIVFTEETSAGIDNMKPGSYIVASVEDNGTGIPRNIIDRVFEPFFTTKNGDKGTGLGLSMVYGFTLQSGGFITIDSTEGKGTKVKLYFPRNEQQAPAALHGVPGNDHNMPIPTGHESLLVVEDQPDVLKYLTQTLRELGYRVTHAGDAQSALKKLGKRKSLDLLVTDVVMPGEMNGEMLAQEARRQLPELKVLYISGYTRDALVEQGALKAGVHLLAKPFTRADLATYVRSVLDNA